MRLENAFTVPAPVESAWAVLLDLERVAPCLPGAALDGGDGPEYSGSMTIKLGPITSRYRGTVRIEEADEAARRAVLQAQARDPRTGSASATISTRLEPADEGTRVTVVTDMRVRGPAAQFGRGVMQDVAGKLMGQFADCLAAQMGVAGEPPAADAAPAPPAAPDAEPPAAIEYEDTRVGRLPLGPAGDAALAAAAAGAPEAAPATEAATAPEATPAPAPESSARPSADVLDLGAASRAAILKRTAPAAVALGAAAAIAIWLGRRRR